MKLVECARCGSTELTEHDGYIVCAYCQSKYVPQADETLAKKTTIGLGSDIEALLKKCKEDPVNRRRYASLILDIDPTNQEANQYFQ